MYKRCSKCGIWKSSRHCFYKNLKRPDGFRCWCKLCCNRDNKKREPKYKEYRKQYAVSERGKQVCKRSSQKYHSTIHGHLKCVFNDIKQRCNNPDCKSFKNYGGRGIQNKFESLDKFRDYVVNELQADPCNLDIDRIDNNGHYEPGNIRFITHKENLANRRNQNDIPMG